MPLALQGDIFSTARERQSDLIIVFGYIGFNQIDLTWRAFAKLFPALADVHDPFSKVPHPYEYAPGRWLWGVSTYEERGMTDSEVRHTLVAGFAWAHANGLRTVITNGVREDTTRRRGGTQRESDDRRARFLIQMASECEQTLSLTVTLISLDDSYTRNTS